ncbi:membrane protein [Rhizobium phage RHph_N38]|uniref:DUF3307 domain-containing protein n=1 Tax=Rhizobium phage RHph_N38 TaxID=2509750 RepID=A0A7S5R3J4_9CAUD|nr:membrane protein [Rhizobium phage RHph_N38]QIG70512.1 hypothetical protein EVB89_049 [Rhizobium phage RHph_N38]
MHFLFDYPLQGDFLGTQKVPSFQPRYIPWYHANFAHAVLHGIPVGIVTGSYTLAISEVLIHFWIDYMKSMKAFGIHLDQFFHILFKGLWVFVAYAAFTTKHSLW